MGDGIFSTAKEEVRSIIGDIERLYGTVDQLLVPKLKECIIPSLTRDAQIFIKNPVDVSAAAPLVVTKECRSRISQICVTRKYKKKNEEFKKYIKACLDEDVKASNPDYDVAIKAVISKDEGLIYLSTFFPGVF